MATLVFTAVGSIFGPIGAAIGGLIGNAFDHAVLFKPKGVEGPRLNDLQLQTSTYGTQIPKLFGTIRVAGTVIWATDLRETRSKSGGGKGRPSVTTYAYSASFAVALSAREVRSVRRPFTSTRARRTATGRSAGRAEAARDGAGPMEAMCRWPRKMNDMRCACWPVRRASAAPKRCSPHGPTMRR